MYSKELIEYRESLSYASPLLASQVLEEVFRGNIPESLPGASFDTDGSDDGDVGDVHPVFNQRSDRFDVQSSLSADQFRQVMAQTASSRPVPSDDSTSVEDSPSNSD
ncbi:hypothetical protein [Microvirus mar36]|uniref:Uncharacterized protein n=1 Tax=Microvirus mar36 TaxID=2851170 RepID=A0A8F5MKN5_9VIRU|nr:hypothetical protein [Microvirus mar36]